MKKRGVYFYATLVAVGIILLNQSFIQYWLYQKREDSRIINISGKQRMLSQKLVNDIYTFKNDQTSIVQVQNTYDTWLNAHLSLKEIFNSNSTSSYNKEILSLLNQLEVYFTNAKDWISEPKTLSDQQMGIFISNQDEFLFKMNSIVQHLEDHSNQKLRLVVTIEIIFALISLTLIFYEIRFVFKKMNGRLKDQNDSLKESNLMLEKYAYLAAHDLRTPTLNINNLAKLLKKKLEGKTNEQEDTFLNIIIESSDRLYNITDDLLRIATINRDEINIKKFQPKKLVNNIINDLNVEIERKKAKIDIENFPEHLEGDPILLSMVFQNLISNGMKFVENEVSPEIKIRYINHSENHVFKIIDNGIGISPEDQNGVFEMFNRLHNNERYKGNGIGLSICQRIVEKHDGAIALESEPRKGSTFTITLPKYYQN